MHCVVVRYDMFTAAGNFQILFVPHSKKITTKERQDVLHQKMKRSKTKDLKPKNTPTQDDNIDTTQWKVVVGMPLLFSVPAS